MRKISIFWQKISIFDKYLHFLTKRSFFEKDFDFWQRNSIFHKKIIFFKFGVSTNISFFTKLSMFYKNVDFRISSWNFQVFRFFIQIVKIYEKKLLFFCVFLKFIFVTFKKIDFRMRRRNFNFEPVSQPNCPWAENSTKNRKLFLAMKN